MHGSDAVRRLRDTARAYEQALDPAHRKRLGQFFSGVRLGKLLANLGIGLDTRTVLDPMAGHGDLLDATWEVASERAIELERIDGIEIDSATASMCRERLAAVLENCRHPESVVLTANAFDLEALNTLPARAYDLVITNPPYVRHQGRNGTSQHVDPTRKGLKQIFASKSRGTSRTVWNALAEGYSGLADLSVPAWILAAFMVREGGRLALVVPATWRSRDYADVIRYLLLRFFAVEIIVTDTQPGWFSDALVRTHLVVAKRVTEEEARKPLGMKNCWPMARWLHVAPNAADERSLVGAAFSGPHPESDFVSWLHEASNVPALGIEISVFDLNHEWTALQSRLSRHRWYRIVEEGNRDLPLFPTLPKPGPSALPDPLRQVLRSGTEITKLVTLEEAGIKIGQGLRTGCNGFFYVTVCKDSDDGMVLAKASSALGSGTFLVPSSALRPVLRRQSEISLIQQGKVPPGRVLDLHAWVLPEDAQCVANANAAYELRGETPPQVMLSELAAYVRHAGSVSLDGKGGGKSIPELSAVRTNVRQPHSNTSRPRFWYMLPDFTPRHLASAFVPRINQKTPWTECNIDPPLLIDANFSTFWSMKDGWPSFAIKALLNSVWCRAYMEATGTPLGGGALKLEATHLRQMPIPMFTHDARIALESAGRCLRPDTQDVQVQIDRTVLQALFPMNAAGTLLSDVAMQIQDQTKALCDARQRVPS